MPDFIYQALQKDGKVIQGSTESESQMSLADKLHRDGLMVVSIKPKRRFGTDPKASSSSSFSTKLLNRLLGSASSSSRNKRVKSSTIMFFLTQLSSMVGSGIPLVNVLISLSEENDNRKMRAILEDVIASVKSGQSLSDSLAKFPRVFDEVFISLTKAGEVSGKLDKTLEEANRYMEKSQAMRQKTQQAMLYPAIILIVFVLITVILVLFIVPQFEDLFSKLGSDLPVPTQILLFVKSAITDNFLITAFLSAVVGIAGYFVHKIESVAYMIDRLVHKVPLFGPLSLKISFTKICRTLGILLDSGVTTTTAIDQLLNISRNRVIKQALMTSIEEIKVGQSLSEAFQSNPVFPRLIVQMISSGEGSGALPEMLEKVADHYEKQVQYTVDTLSTVIEPIMITTIAVFVGLILYAIYMPIFKMGEAIKGSM